MLALLEKQVPFESRYMDMLAFDQHSPAYLAINPNGTLPAMVHDGVVLTESTAIMEYIDEMFPGQPLRPSDPLERWRMRWWGRFLDQFVGPSVSMIGWSIFVGPSVRARDPGDLTAAIERIPLQERRIAWSKALFGTFSQQELAESGARIALGMGEVETALAQRPWLAGASYSLADIAGWNMLFGMPSMLPDLVNDARTPHTMEWLRKLYERPAVRAMAAYGRTEIMKRLASLERPNRA
jgi:glutathione S-transferase/GST-like protein